MSDAKPTVEFPREPAVRNYIFVSFAALAVVFFALVRLFRLDIRYMDGPSTVRLLFCLVPVLVGVAGLLRGWRLGPLITLIIVVVPLFFREIHEAAGPRPSDELQPRHFDLTDWVLCGGLLAYVAAHYRILGLTVSILPRERATRSDPKTPPAEIKRGAHLVSPVEVSWLVLSLPIWAFLAQSVWVSLPRHIKLMNLHPKTWQGILLCWLIAGGLLIAAGFLRHIRLRSLRREEAILLMNDTLWAETRGEQRRIQSWLAWGRLRRPQKERP
jgi:hypothetical protein